MNVFVRISVLIQTESHINYTEIQVFLQSGVRECHYVILCDPDPEALPRRSYDSYPVIT